MKSKDTTIKKVKGFSSAYPNVCNLKLLPNIDRTWITIQDDIGTSMTIKLSDLSDFVMLCGDAISKADVKKYLSAPDVNGDRVIYESDLDLLPPVTPQTKMGRWFLSGGYWRCSECKEKALLKLDKSKGSCKEYMPIKSNFCPNCGAKMEEVEE